MRRENGGKGRDRAVPTDPTTSDHTARMTHVSLTGRAPPEAHRQQREHTRNALRIALQLKDHLHRAALG